MGVLGSAFNPPHIGHLILAQEAFAQLALSEVLLVPTGRAPHKRIEADPGAGVRVEMTQLAAGDDDRLGVSELEAERDEVSYSFRTLELLREQRPGDEPVWIMGADAAVELGTWRRPERVLELARLGVVERGGVTRADVESVLEELSAGGGAEFVDMPAIEVSSTMVRERVAGGRPIRYLVPDAVAALIEERGLYPGVAEGAGGSRTA
ncbi:MAG TPA: nicotinate-nucleotide adenylyltransferase [Solirubrobacterales bacterium]|nr:nicotinate-nucleotide adenylyltransferase [Solirubrobacterales bacterium]